MESKNREFLLKDEKVKKALLVMIVPALIAGGINMLNVIMDTFFLGNFAAHPLDAQAATATSMAVILLMNGFSFMIGIGTAVTASQLLGAGKKDKVEQYMANSFVAGWILYILLLLVMIPLTPWIVEILTGSDSGLFYTNSMVYLTIMIIGFPTLIFTQLSSQTIRAEGQAMLIVKVSIFQVILNAILNYVLISDTFSAISFYGTNYEAAGAAIATISSQGVMAIILMSILFRKSKTNYFINFKRLKFEKGWLMIFRNGFPQFLASLFFAIGITIISLSAIEVSQSLGYTQTQTTILSNASGITVKLVLMVFLLINGAIQGIQGFFAYQYGSQRYDRLLDGISIVRRLAFYTGIGMFIVFFFGAETIAKIFTDDEQVISLVTLSMKFLAITTLIFPTAHMYFGLFASLGKPRLAMLSSFIRDFVFLSGFAILFPILFKAQGVMVTMPIALFCGSLFIIILGSLNIRKMEKNLKVI